MRSAVLSLVLAVSTLISVPAFASGPDCPCEADRAQLTDFRNKLAHADTPDEARNMALSKTKLSHKAIETASKVFPNDPEVAVAEQRLDAFEDGVQKAETQEEVALQFDNLMAQQVAGSCDFTTVEIVISLRVSTKNPSVTIASWNSPRMPPGANRRSKRNATKIMMNTIE